MKSDKNIYSDFDTVRSLEWIETNGLGGYASGTVSGANTRRYHGLLIAATNPPVGRISLLAKLDETLTIGEHSYELGTNQYPGVLHPSGYLYLTHFERDLFPEFTYSVAGVVLKKTIAAVHCENSTLVVYDVLEAPAAFTMDLLPLYSSRDLHSVCHANDNISPYYLLDEGIFRTLNYHGNPELFVSIPGSEFKESKAWYHNIEYAIDQERGLDYQEDLYTHGKFTVQLKKGDRLGIIISDENPSGRDAFKLFETEKNRREQLTVSFSWDRNVRRLVLAADQFIVKRESYKTIIAGYPWFTDWGRDTMIALPGLCLVTGRFDEAKQILLQFSKYVSEGMLPNRFPDNGEAPEYNTIDATLWFFLAIYQYFKYTDDKEFVMSMIPILEDIIASHYKGTRYNIKVDPTDELLSGGTVGAQLTWMDAKVSDWVVTPRRGKAVEINALWYNALCTLEALFAQLEMKYESTVYKAKAKRVLESFTKLFWNEQLGSLYDYIDGDTKNDDIRPNQIYAVSLPFPLLEKERARSIFDTVTEHLLTPKGLRSLSPLHKDYKPTYCGDIWSRDGAYHQGTVWSFFIGPYIDAMIKVRGEKQKNETSRILLQFVEHLNEAGIGTVSEIFDAAFPHAPKGCIAQAWGVGEALRVAVEYDLLARPKKSGSSPRKQHVQ